MCNIWYQRLILLFLNLRRQVVEMYVFNTKFFLTRRNLKRLLKIELRNIIQPPATLW